MSFLVVWTPSSQAQDLTFSRLDAGEGLSNLIRTVIQDRRGYLWMGGVGGLFRYDGYGVTALIKDDVTYIHESDDGTLWVGTWGGGLNRFDPASETFRAYRHVEGDAASLSDNDVSAIVETDDGTLWIGTRGGLSRFDPASETFHAYRHADDDSDGLSNSEVAAVLESLDGTLWIGTLGGGLKRFDPASETFHAYRHVGGDAASLSNDFVWALHESNDGTLWVGTWGGGLNRFDPASETFRAYRHVEGDAASLSDNDVSAIVETDDGTLWIGTRGGGLNRFDPASESFHAYGHVEGGASNLGHDDVWTIHETDDGMLWIGTWGSGLYRFDPARGTFRVRRHVEGNAASLSADLVRALHESNDGTIWIGTLGGGLNHFDPASETFHGYRHVGGDAASLNDDDVRAIFETDDGTLWVGTRSGGLNRFDPTRETFHTYRHIDGDSTSLSHDNVWVLYEGNDGTLWIGTQGGLNRFDSASETFDAYRHVEGDVATLSDSEVRSILETDDGTLWVGTRRGGLNRFDPASETFYTYRHIEGDSTSLSHDHVRTIYESRDGTLWIGTVAGLNRLESDPDSERDRVSFTRFLGEEGTSLSSIVEDDEGRLWLGFLSGRLARFDPENGRVRYFGRSHGLPVGAFTSGAALRGRSGTLYWGNANGLISLRLEDLPPPGKPPVLHLSELRLFDELLTPGPDSPLERPLSETEEVTLSHNQNDLTFGFVGLHYADPEANRYRYRLLGYDRTWRGETYQRQATYTSLPPGNYTFEVTAANSDGIWTDEPVRLGVEILPPWWRTWWAYGLYGLLVMTGIFAVDRIQRRQVLAKERERARERELAQAREIERAYGRLEKAHSDLETAHADLAQTHTDLEQAHSDLEQAHARVQAAQQQLVQQEKMASLGSLTAGIAHEIKNPLNFVNNFAGLSQELFDDLQDAMNRGDAEDVAAILADLRINIAKIEEHGQRADGIVSSMMQHARGGEGQRELIDLNALVSEYVDLAWHGKRAQVPDFNVDVERNLDEGVGQVELIPQEIGRVVLNLVGNAFDAVRERAAHVDGQYAPRVTVSTRRRSTEVEIRVADNGSGISPEVCAKIFEPFFTTKPTGSGTGLGLSLSYDIVTQGHGGKLDVTRGEENGAIFIITLPCDAERS